MGSQNIKTYMKTAPLIISVLVVIPAALIYGFKPSLLLDLRIATNDEHSFSKGVMGLYFAFSILWLFGIFNSKFLRFALISNSLFMLGLAFGRLISMCFDGIPSITYIIGTVGELTLGLYSLVAVNSKTA